ncbi:GGDEF domain-containing protein [Actinotalea sp.]|uniref:GGDEF domain-containing protein n=1 Tax=Actinotalea sp. TaxID=1872145 RepID=UPI002D06B589|nr:GGDEF domain-containing protein [Actinotalea sp.]HQY34235.1 GGDEF domain-containing protein [Actinotalea sp.]HRA51048.1 GGDEF domain-containing protein [Actinotalea sp.]
MIPRSLTRGAALRQETRGWVLALVLMLGALVCILMARGPVAPLEQLPPAVGQLDVPRAVMLQVAAAALLVLAIPAVTLRRHTGVLWWLVVGSIVVNSVVLAGATSTAGLVLTSMAYTYAVLYAAYAFERRLLVGVLVAVLVGSLVGSALSATGFRFIVWFSTVGGVVGAGAVLGHVMQLLRWYATVDALTGVLTRTAFDATAHSALSSARRRGAQSVLVLIDLDGFKAVNDTHGHAAGDELLVATVEAWGRRLRGQDVLGRSGGDEFVLLLPDTDLAGARVLVETLGEVSPIAFSAGLALAGPEDTLDHLLRRADAGMYEVKRTRMDAGGA